VPEKLDLFRRALAGATRAIAKDPEVEVVFASDTASPAGRAARVPSPGAGLEPKLVAEARGAADSAALKLRHHDARLHSSLAPADPEAGRDEVVDAQSDGEAVGRGPTVKAPN